MLAASLEAELQAETIRARAHVREADRGRGVGWSGLGPDPFRARGPEALLADAGDRQARLEAWRASGPGRLASALARAQQAAHAAHAAAETARAALARRADGGLPPCAMELARLEAGAQELLRQAAAARAVLGG